MKKIRDIVISIFVVIGFNTEVSGFSDETKKTYNSENEINIEQSAYNEGWDEGFCEGWKDEKGQFSICPITPIAPIPKINCMEGFRCGYNRGFKYGICKAMGRSNCKK